MIVLQNAGIERTSVSHAALIVGAVPALVALIARRRPARGIARGPAAWVGFALALAGVGIVAGGGGGGATLGGDALVLLSVTLSATFVVVQPSLLRGPRPDRGDRGADDRGRRSRPCRTRRSRASRPRPRSRRPVVALVALAFAGTLLPFALFAYGQSRVAPELAGAFLNLEPLVGTAAGALAFGDPFGPLQLRGGAVILARHRAQHHPRGAAPRTPKVALRTTRRQAAPSDERGHGGRLRPCSTPVSTRSTSPRHPGHRVRKGR